MKKLLAMLLVLFFAAPAMAAEFDFYGSARVQMGYHDIDDDYGSLTNAAGNEVLGGPNMDGALIPGQSGFFLNQNVTSRFGARINATDNLTGQIEFGLRAYDDRNVLRLGFGTWNFGAGSIVVGQDYTPAVFLGYSTMIGDFGDGGDGGLHFAGLPYIVRQPQVKLIMGDLNVALIRRNAAVTGEDHTPRIEASYVLRTPMANIRAVGGFQSYKDTAIDTTITSYLVGVGASLDLNPAYLRAVVSYQQNQGNYGNTNALLPFLTTATADDDAVSYQGVLVGGMNLSPMMRAEVGMSYMYNMLGDEDQDAMLFYAQLPLLLDKGMLFTPEVGYVARGDREDDRPGLPDEEYGNMFYVTAQFRVDF